MNIFVSDGKVLSQDRAFNYGDGIFTTTHVQHGKIQLFDFRGVDQSSFEDVPPKDQQLGGKRYSERYSPYH